jgi:hypothetical protein
MMTTHTCTFTGCKRSIDLPDVILMPPEGWRYIWTSGDDPKIGIIKEGLYCEPHAEVIDRRIAQAYSNVAPPRRPRGTRR